MGEKNTPDELLIHVEYIREAVDGIKERLDKLNGRTGKNETDIAVLKDRQSERDREARQAGVTAGRNWGAGAGTAGGFLGGAVAGFFQKWMTGQ